jgi:hypothetical protein
MREGSNGTKGTAGTPIGERTQAMFLCSLCSFALRERNVGEKAG